MNMYWCIGTAGSAGSPVVAGGPRGPGVRPSPHRTGLDFDVVRYLGCNTNANAAQSVSVFDVDMVRYLGLHANATHYCATPMHIWGCSYEVA